MESTNQQKQDSKSFLGFLRPFAPKQGNSATTGQKTDASNETTDSDSDSTRSNRGLGAPAKTQHEHADNVREEDNVFEAVLDNPPQKRTSFLAMFSNNSDSDIEVDPKELIGEYSSKIEAKAKEIKQETLSVSNADTTQVHATKESEAPPKKASGFFAGLFSSEKQQHDEQKPTTEVAEEKDKSNKNNGTVDAPIGNKDGKSFFGMFFSQKPAPENLDVAESQATIEPKGDSEIEKERDVPSTDTNSGNSQLSSTDNVEENTETGFFGRLFQRKQNQELSEEDSNDTSAEDPEVGKQSCSKEAEKDGDAEAPTVKDSPSKNAEANTRLEDITAERTHDLKSNDKPSGFFGLFVRGKEPGDDSKASSASGTVDNAKEESQQQDYVGSNDDADFGNLGNDNLNTDLQLAEKDSVDDSVVSDKSGSAFDGVQPKSFVTDTKVHEEKSAAESPGKQEDQIFLGAEEAKAKTEEEGAALDTPMAFDDPYWDDNIKASKEKMCCSIFIC